MDNLLADRNVVSAERWRAWKAKGRQHDRAIARKIKFAAGVLVGLIALAGAIYFFLPR